MHVRCLFVMFLAIGRFKAAIPRQRQIAAEGNVKFVLSEPTS
jgi:hypothetical protein